LISKAQEAFDRGSFLEPEDDNALKWAREAQKAGKPSAMRIEDQVYSNMMKDLAQLRADHNYDSALMLVNAMVRAFPNHNSLPTVRRAIQRDKDASE
jgi:hypothetical protein